MRTLSKEKESVLVKAQKIFQESKKCAEGSAFRTLFIAVKEQILCRLGISRIDYFTCEMYKLGWLGRREFIDTKKAKRIRDVCNERTSCAKFRDKSKFNKAFADFIHRDWLDLRKDTFESFEQFVLKHPVFMVKPQFLDGGRGIHKQEITDKTDINKLYSELKKEGALLEEIIVQCKELAEFNESSVNTIRLVTLLDAKNNVHIMSGVLRMGTGNNCADNFHTNGIAATVDIETGIVVTSAVSRDLKRYYIHPQSKKQIIGYHVPMWKDMIETVKKAAYVVPKVRYVGWDIAINSSNEIVLIEGNDNAARDVQQMPDLKGKWLKYKPFINELEKRRV